MAEKVAGPGEEGQASEADERRALEELAKLTVEPMELRMADGRRIAVRPVRGRQFAAYSRAMRPIRAAARARAQNGGKDAERDFVDVMAEHADEVFTVIRVCTGLGDEELDALGPGDLFMLFGAAGKVNADFFAAGAVAAAARARLDGVEFMPEGAAPAAGSTPSSTSSGMDTASRT